MKMQSSFARNLVLVFVFLLVCACAAPAEFQAIPQKGASRSGVYPRFSDRPQAETSQFSIEEQDRLTRELEGDAQRLHGIIRQRQGAGASPARPERGTGG